MAIIDFYSFFCLVVVFFTLLYKVFKAAISESSLYATLNEVRETVLQKIYDYWRIKMEGVESIEEKSACMQAMIEATETINQLMSEASASPDDKEQKKPAADIEDNVVPLHPK